MKKPALLTAMLVITGFTSSCGYGPKIAKPPSQLTTRVFASQSVSSANTSAGLIIVDGAFDTLARALAVSTGGSPGLMAISPDRSTLLVFDSASNAIDVVDTRTEALSGSITMPGQTTSMAALNTGFGYVAVPSAPFIGAPPGAIEIINLTAGGTAATLSVPNAQTVVASPLGTQLLAFSADSDSLTVISPLLVNTGAATTTIVPGFDRPAYAVFSADGSTAYVLNCGAECGGTQASVQALDVATLTPGIPVPVDGATVGWLSGSTLYVAGNSAANSSCAGETTAATTCGRLDTVDVGLMAVTGSVAITDGYHDRMDMSVNGQLFIGSKGCTNIGNVNNPQGEVRGCLSILNTANGTLIIPPDNGDVTGLQSFTTRYVEYVAEGGHLRVYDTTIDSLLLTSFISTGTITTPGQIVDVKAVDFF